MRRRCAAALPLLAIALLGAALLVVGLPGSAPFATAAPDPTGLTAASTQPRLSTSVGQHLDYRVSIVNDGHSATGQLLAHLNIASVTGGTYVDPEDWSAERSRFLPALAPGAAVALTWDVQAVSPGTFALYVVVLPAGMAATPDQRLVVSTPTRVEVAARRTLNAGGALPVAVAVPVLLGLVALAGRGRNRARLRR
ncbi:MAG: hypothetical protein QOE23_2482 [Pseudonocardiales bacterium]|jgi:hypothetical protein|nr:hypothetical protein [Pseudonocardiales bacterium]